ncbi:hypothetical protein DHEL01_v212408 [Diaporthe helianthi]|uniref:Rhodopsin domain-containing protein n=1 Tax=Diaporthe helianthi TaxID=158607 RepID=A0A2P5HG30_DIAHE|nr:hypothetical protein DHEL01_v212408 [Diaporthe helianthi]
MSVWESDDLGLVALRTTWPLFGVTAVVFALRIYCRLRYTPRLGGGLYVDDFITGGCLLMLLVFCILLSVAVQDGVGKHYVTLSDHAKLQAGMWNAILSGLTPWMCTLPKFAIITTLKRILNYGTKTAVLLWGLALSSQASVVALTAWGFAQCTPTPFQWDRSIAGGTCSDPAIYVNLSFFVYSYSTALDVFFALYPVPFVMRLSMPLKTRIGVSASLSLSWVGFGISIYKFSIFDKIGALLVTDPSFPLVYLCMTHAAEGSFLMISTSLATLRPLFRSMKRHVSTVAGNSNEPSKRRTVGHSRAFHPCSHSQVNCIITSRSNAEWVPLDNQPGNDTDAVRDITVQKTIEVSVSNQSLSGQTSQSNSTVDRDPRYSL